ncbi:MAG TPA: hypothetical protein VLM40_23590 [Gemmata sp.]|nr:hypothetical protein [Gemmata sp.]
MRSSTSPVLFLFATLAIPMSDPPALSDPPKGRYVFVQNTDRWVGVVRGNWHLVGKFDANGEFLQDMKLKKGQSYSAGIPPHGIINSSGHATLSRKVYELRSGVLVPGEILPDGSFVPETGGKIIPFKDYNYSPTATPIWNLPGAFLTVEEAAKLKMAKFAEKK